MVKKNESKKLQVHGLGYKKDSRFEEGFSLALNLKKRDGSYAKFDIPISELAAMTFYFNRIIVSLMNQEGESGLEKIRSAVEETYPEILPWFDVQIGR